MSSVLNDRYGIKQQKKALPQWFWYALAGLALLVSLVFVYWVQSDRASDPTTRDVGYNIISSDEATGTFELIKNPEDSAVCAIKALNSARAPVGWKEVAIGPASDPHAASTVHTVTLRTLSEATTVTVDSCWLQD